MLDSSDEVGTVTGYNAGTFEITLCGNARAGQVCDVSFEVNFPFCLDTHFSTKDACEELIKPLMQAQKLSVVQALMPVCSFS